MMEREIGNVEESLSLSKGANDLERVARFVAKVRS